MKPTERIVRPWPGVLSPGDMLMIAIFGPPPEWTEHLAALEAKAKADEETRLWDMAAKTAALAAEYRPGTWHPAVARGWQPKAVIIADSGVVFSATLYGEDGIGFDVKPLTEEDIAVTVVRAPRAGR